MIKSVRAAENPAKYYVREERFSKTRLLLQVAQTLGILFVAISLYVSWRSLQDQQRGFKDQHELSRRQNTSVLLARFNSEIESRRAPIMRAFPGLYNQASQGPLSLDKCREIMKAKKGELSIEGVDAFDLRNDIAAVFNYFEDIARDWEYQIVDQSAVRESVGHVILRWHNFFQNFIEAAKEENGTDPWPPLTRVVGTWKADSSPQVKQIPRTGSEDGRGH
jgi:hypothetical protein